MNLEAIRAANLAQLSDCGFRIALPLPVPHGRPALRPVCEIAERLLALDVVLTWVLRAEHEAPAAGVRASVALHDLERVMTRGELAIYHRDRDAACASYTEALAWRLESMWPLAWILGFAPEPTFDGQMTSRALIQQIVGFLPPRDQPLGPWLARASVRSVEEVVRLEDRFHCCHVAVRSAQLGGATVPARFHPVVNGGVIHERRHALTWALAPQTAWDDMELA